MTLSKVVVHSKTGDYVYVCEISYNKGKSWSYSSTFLTEHNALRSASLWNKNHPTMKRILRFGKIEVMGVKHLGSNGVWKYQKSKKFLPDSYDGLAMKELVDSHLPRGEL